MTIPTRIIDARGSAGFDALHISGSYHVPLAMFRECPEEFAEKVGTRFALVCQSGDRAEQARKHLNAVGAGLTYSAATNSCAVGQVLSKVPWNRTADEPTGHHALQKLGSRP